MKKNIRNGKSLFCVLLATLFVCGSAFSAELSSSSYNKINVPGSSSNFGKNSGVVEIQMLDLSDYLKKNASQISECTIRILNPDSLKIGQAADHLRRRFFRYRRASVFRGEKASRLEYELR